jgi:ABC-type glycerol-3-phosphate transport system substrate-binding protein
LPVIACTPAPKETKIADPGTAVSGTVELWHFFTEREAAAIDDVVKDFESTHPNIKVTVKSGPDDSKVTQAIGAGNGAAAHLAPATGAKWPTADGKSAVGTDPAWKTLMAWQKSLVDWYGYDNLTKFRAGLGDESSARCRRRSSRSCPACPPRTPWRS